MLSSWRFATMSSRYFWWRAANVACFYNGTLADSGSGFDVLPLLILRLGATFVSSEVLAANEDRCIAFLGRADAALVWRTFVSSTCALAGLMFVST